MILRWPIKLVTFPTKFPLDSFFKTEVKSHDFSTPVSYKVNESEERIWKEAWESYFGLLWFHYLCCDFEECATGKSTKLDRLPEYLRDTVDWFMG